MVKLLRQFLRLACQTPHVMGTMGHMQQVEDEVRSTKMQVAVAGAVLLAVQYLLNSIKPVTLKTFFDRVPAPWRLYFQASWHNAKHTHSSKLAKGAETTRSCTTIGSQVLSACTCSQEGLRLWPLVLFVEGLAGCQPVKMKNNKHVPGK